MLLLLLALLLCAAAPATAQPSAFEPQAHATFTTPRPDGRYVSTRGWLASQMARTPMRLAFREDMDAAAFPAWQDSVRAVMARLMACPYVPDTVRPRLLATVRREGYTLARWECYPFAGYAVRYLVLTPDGVSASHPAPAVLCIPGWCQTKEELCGEPVPAAALRESDPDGATFAPEAKVQAGMAVQYARAGYVAVAVDNPGTGEADDLERLAGSWRYDFQTIARALLEDGWSYLGLMTHTDRHVLQAMRQMPCVRRDRLVVSGFSFGTEPLMALGVLEQDICAFVYNDFLCATRERALVLTKPDAHGYRPWPNDIEHLIPGMLRALDFPDLVAALAPRPVLCTEGGMDRDFRRVARAYALCGAPCAFKGVHYARYADPATRQQLEAMPRGIDGDTFFRLANVDPPHHGFKAEHALPWLKATLQSLR